MKKDVRKKSAAASSSSMLVKLELSRLLNLAQELETIYKTYPQLQAVVGRNAWHELTDIVYRDLLELNLDTDNSRLRAGIAENFRYLEDLSASTLVRDDAGLRDTVARVLRYRIANGLVSRRAS